MKTAALAALALSLVQEQPVPEMKRLWTLSGARSIIASSEVIIVYADTAVARISPTKGEERWRTETAGIREAPTVGRRHVYVAGGTYIAAYSVASGKEEWRWEHTEINQSPLVLSSSLVVRRADFLHARSFDNKELWRTKVGGEPQRAPDGSIWAVSATEIWDLDASNGKIRWTAKPPPQDSFIAASGDSRGLIAATREGLAAFDASSGAAQWALRFGQTYGALSLDRERVYSSFTLGAKGGVIAVGRKDGQRAWEFEAAPRTRIVLHNGVLYWTAKGEVGAVVAATGAQQWKVRALPAAEGDSEIKAHDNGLVVQYGTHAAFVGRDGSLQGRNKLSLTSPQVSIVMMTGWAIVGMCDALDLPAPPPPKK